MCQNEGECIRERESERERDGQTDRQTDRQREREKGYAVEIFAESSDIDIPIG